MFASRCSPAPHVCLLLYSHQLFRIFTLSNVCNLSVEMSVKYKSVEMGSLPQQSNYAGASHFVSQSKHEDITGTFRGEKDRLTKIRLDTGKENQQNLYSTNFSKPGALKQVQEEKQ